MFGMSSSQKGSYALIAALWDLLSRQISDSDIVRKGPEVALVMPDPVANTSTVLNRSTTMAVD